MLKASPEKAITVIAGMPVKSLIGHQEQKLATIFSEERSGGVSATFMLLKRRPWQHVIVMRNLGKRTERAHRAPRQRFTPPNFEDCILWSILSSFKLKSAFFFFCLFYLNPPQTLLVDSLLCLLLKGSFSWKQEAAKIKFLFFLTSITTRSERLIQSGDGQTKMATLH